MDLRKNSVSLEDYLNHTFTSKREKQTLNFDTAEDEIGILIVNYRHKHHLTQSQLGKRADLPQSSVARIESGCNFKIDTLLKLANAMNVKVRELIPSAA